LPVRGQGSRAGTDLKNQIVGSDLGRLHDPLQMHALGQKVLTEPLGKRHSVRLEQAF
jgi:hypothetical protein